MRGKLLVIGVIVGLGMAASACGGPLVYNVVSTQRMPGADARVQVETIDGGNHLVTVSASNLAPPDRLGSGATTYLVWFRFPNGTSTLASPLAYNVGDRTGRATATTPQTRFTLLITAESSSSVSQPGDFVVFQQNVQL